MRRVGQTTSDDAATAASDAAYTRAQQSSWPPTEGDYQAVGAVAGAAAGTVIGGPIGAAIGSAVGTAVGSGVFSLVEAIGGGLDPNRGNDGPVYMYNLRREIVPAAQVAATELAVLCGTSSQYEITKFQQRGLRVKDDGIAEEWQAWEDAAKHGGIASTVKPSVEIFQRTLFASTAARVAECETLKQTKGSSKNSPGAIITLGVISFIGVGILQKFITRGKF